MSNVTQRIESEMRAGKLYVGGEYTGELLNYGSALKYKQDERDNKGVWSSKGLYGFASASGDTSYYEVGANVDYHRDPIQRKQYGEYNKDVLSTKIERLAEKIYKGKKFDDLSSTESIAKYLRDNVKGWHIPLEDHNRKTQYELGRIHLDEDEDVYKKLRIVPV